MDEPDQQGNLAQPPTRGQLVPPAVQAIRAQPALLVQQDRLVLVALLVQQAPLEVQVPQEEVGIQAPRALLA